MLEPRVPAGRGPVTDGSLARALASGLPSTRQLLDTFGPLASSVAAAHRHGRAVGCAHLSRIRLAGDGRLEAAITPPPPGTDLDQDVRGLGGVLYALLTGYWPLSADHADPGGLPRAPRDQAGAPVTPSLLRHGLAPELSALAMAALGEGVDSTHTRVRTAAAIARVVGDLRGEWSAEVLPLPEHTGPDRRELGNAGTDWAPGSRDPSTTRKLSMGMAGLAIGTLVVLCFLAYQLSSMLGIGPPSAPRVVVGANIPAASIPAVVLPPAVVPPLTPPGALPTAGMPPVGGPPVSLPPTGGLSPTQSGAQDQQARGSDKDKSDKDKKAKKRRRSSDD